MTATACKSDFKLTTDTPYLALPGEGTGCLLCLEGGLWDVYYENFEEKWARYNDIALYIYCNTHEWRDAESWIVPCIEV